MTTRPPAASAQSRIVLQTAFDRFSDVVSQDDKHVFNNTTLQDVMEEALHIERGLREKRMAQNMLRLEPFLKGLERYSKAIEVLCNGTPFLPWIWAPVKLMLLSALDALGAFEKLIEAYGKIAHVLPRLERLSTALSHDVNFQNVLALVYSDILEIHRNSYKFVRRKSWAILFGSTWARFETRFSGILQRLAYHSDLLDREACAINISETLKHNEEEIWRWEQQDAELEASKYHTVLSWLRMNESSPEYIFEEHCRKSLPDSCDWFMNQDKMQLWRRDGSENALVWITGKPGAGKSFLCSNVVRSIRTTGLEVLYYFCSYLGDSSDRCSQLLRSLACQIIQKRRDLAMHVYDTYYVSHPKPDTPVTVNILRELLLELGSTRIVVDGVDEWGENQRELLTNLKKLICTDPSSYTCKILVSSRDTLEVSRNFVRRSKTIAFSNLSDRFESAAIKHSISNFVEARLKKIPSHFDSLDPDGSIMARIKHQLLEKSNGMFLWVRLVLDSFSTTYSPEGLSTIVENLPTELNPLYTQIFHRLCSVAGPQSFGGVPRILSWICYAQRPLHKHELAHAISIGSLGFHHNDLSIPVVDILDHCKPLIEFRQDGTVTFVHFSVKEFLVACSTPGIIPFPQAQLDLASACVGLLTRGLDLLRKIVGQPEIMVQVAGGSYRLLPYAIEFWIEHCLLCIRDVGASVTHRALLEWLSLLQDKHSFLIQMLGHEPRHNNASVLSETDIDQRLEPYTGWPAHTLMREILRTQRFVSRQNCDNGEDAESCMEQYDPTLLNKLAVEFERNRVILLSYDTVDGVPPRTLFAFQKSYTSMTLRCRFPNCLGASEGFPSEQLRARHETGHVRRVYCKVESCQYHRIGFKNKSAHDKHDREFHREGHVIVVPRKIRRVSKTQVFRLSLRTKEDSSRPDQSITNQQDFQIGGPNRVDQQKATDSLHGEPFTDRPPIAATHNHFVDHYRDQQQQGKVPQGWQRSTPPEERGQLAFQFFTQFRLLKPEIPELEAMRTSIQFETRGFMEYQIKDHYLSNIKQRLMQMTAARQQQQQQQHLQEYQQQQQVLEYQQQQQQKYPSLPGQQQQYPLPPQAERQFINQLAKKLMDSCTGEVLVKFQNEVNAWPEEKKHQLLSQGIDPLFFRFRTHAEMLYRNGKVSMPQHIR